MNGCFKLNKWGNTTALNCMCIAAYFSYFPVSAQIAIPQATGVPTTTNTVVQPQWFTAYRTDAGYVLDPNDELSKCPQVLEEEISLQYRSVAKREVVRRGDSSHTWLYPVTKSLPVNQQTELAALRKKPFKVIAENGTSAVDLPFSVAMYVENIGPCLHLASFSVSKLTQLDLSSTSKLLVSTQKVKSGTRFLKENEVTRFAFSNARPPILEMTKEGQSVTNWVKTQPALMASLMRDMPPPDPNYRYKLCTPRFQSFRTTIANQKTDMISLQLKWCECKEFAYDSVSAPCVNLVDVGESGNQLLMIADKSRQKNAAVWSSAVSLGNGLQFWQIEGRVAHNGTPNDYVVGREWHYEGSIKIILQKEPKSKSFRMTPLSSYTGL